MMNEDDDEMQRKLKIAENNLNIDPVLKERQDFILTHIDQLKVGDLMKRVDSLVALNEIISGSGNASESPE